MAYKGGVFTVPGSTGNFTVTGLGFKPKAVLFFGSNSNTYDTVVTSAVSAVMRGTMVHDTLTNSIVSWCSSAVPHSASRWEQQPIVCCDNSGTTGTDYQASAVSFDSDGFTVNFTVVPGGTRQIHYVAVGLMRTFAKIIGSNFGGTSATGVDAGFELLSGLEIGGLDDTVIDPLGANREADDWGHMLTWGGRAYYGTDQPSMYLCAVDTPFSGNSCYLQMLVGTAATAYIGEQGHFTGPFLTPASVQMNKSTGTLVDLDVGPDNQGHFTGLAAESDVGFVTPATSTSGTCDITSSNPKVETPALILLLGSCGRPNGLAGGNTNAISIGFWTPEHQYSAAANGVDDSFFQSAQYGFCSKVTASGAHAGTVDTLFPADGARLTTQVAGVTPADMVWHMFGPPQFNWQPHIYRRVFR